LFHNVSIPPVTIVLSCSLSSECNYGSNSSFCRIIKVNL